MRRSKTRVLKWCASGSFAFVALAQHTAAHAQSCATSSNRTIDALGPVTITGTLRRASGEHPARGRFTYYYIELPSRVCFANVESIDGSSRQDHDVVTRLQIMSPRRARIGRTITMTGSIVVGHTAWHVEELLLLS
jgi:hypothetical protein